MTAVGDVVDTVEYDIEPGKIREFARATYVEDPVHTDGRMAAERGFGAAPATLTHTVVAGHQRDQRAFLATLGMALDRVVVGSVRWRYHRPLLAGDHVVGVRRVAGDERRRNSRGAELRMVTLATDYVDTAGDTVATLTETLIERGPRA